MKILLSIRPIYTERIFNGTKKYEYRKRIFKNNSVNKVLVYATQPIGMLIGEFDIEFIEYDDPYKLWQRTKDYSGVEYSFYKEYFRGCSIAIAIKIGAIHKFANPISPGILIKNFTPPQSFKYIKSDDADG